MGGPAEGKLPRRREGTPYHGRRRRSGAKEGTVTGTLRVILADRTTSNRRRTKIALAIYRLGHWRHYDCRSRVVRWLSGVLYKLLDDVYVRTLMSGELPARCHLGARPSFPHGLNGVVIHPRATIGDDARIYHQVTIGVSVPGGEVPTIGDRVLIGAGAKVLGGLTVGDDARIGANAVVLTDVPPGATAVGVPAKVVASSTDHPAA